MDVSCVVQTKNIYVPTFIKLQLNIAYVWKCVRPRLFLFS
jgi:hypothetical protein